MLYQLSYTPKQQILSFIELPYEHRDTALETGMLPLHHTPKRYVIHYQLYILYLSPGVLSRGYAKIIVKISAPYFKGTIGKLSFCIQAVYLKSFFIKLKKNSQGGKKCIKPEQI